MIMSLQVQGLSYAHPDKDILFQNMRTHKKASDIIYHAESFFSYTIQLII